MVGTMTSFHDQIHIENPATLARTMFVDTFGVRATDFDIDRRMQDTLFNSGASAAKQFLEGWDFDDYVESTGW
jgi:NTE family protein